MIVINTKHEAYLLIGMRKEKERSWFQYGSIGFMGSGEDSRFKYSFVESSLKLLLLAPMICKISVEYRTTWVYRANSSYNISPCWTCSQLLRIIRLFSIFSSIESLNDLNLICNDMFQIMQVVHLNKNKLNPGCIRDCIKDQQV